MRTQDWKSPRPLMRITGIAFAVACAASMAVTIAWVPTSNGSPKVLVARTELQLNAVQLRGPDTAPPGLRGTTAKCAACGAIEPTRATGKPSDGGGADRYAARVDSAAVTTDHNQNAGNADLAIFLDWHMNARNANGSVRHEFGCALSCRDSGSRF